MDKNTFNKIIIKVKELLSINEPNIQKCITEEANDGSIIKQEKIYQIIDSYGDVNQFNSEELKIGICYSGNYEITLKYIIDSIIHSNSIVLANMLNERFTTLIVSIFNAALEEVRVKSPIIKYNCSENELCDEKELNTIIYIGIKGNFELFCKEYEGNATIKYDSFECIKLVLDVSNKDNRTIYSQIFAYCYHNNINLDRYNNIDELLEDNESTDYIVVYTNEEEKLKMIKYKKIWINSFPYDEYKFSIVK